MKIAHIINPVKVSSTSDLYIAQPITFKTMKMAKDFTKGIEIELLTTHYPEDANISPDGFRTVAMLEESILDYSTFEVQRKLPILEDILSRMYHATDADYCIYTNVDIALQPHFYLAVQAIIQQGYDAFVINRRTISKQYTHTDEIPLMYAELGEIHKGHDCFIFRRNLIPQFCLGKIAIGTRYIGRALLFNIILTSKEFKEFRDSHLTFHIGEDRAWQADQYNDYQSYNLNELSKIIETLESKYGSFSTNEKLRPFFGEYMRGLGDNKSTKNKRTIINRIFRKLGL